jgi:hypothetical protein
MSNKDEKHNSIKIIYTYGDIHEKNRNSIHGSSCSRMQQTK